jgi:hypothetical protein
VSASVATIVPARTLAPLIAITMAAAALIAFAVISDVLSGSGSGIVFAGSPRSTPAAAISAARRPRSQRTCRRFTGGFRARWSARRSLTLTGIYRWSRSERKARSPASAARANIASAIRGGIPGCGGFACTRCHLFRSAASGRRCAAGLG